MVHLTAREHAQVLALLENPPKPNAKLRAAMAAMAASAALLRHQLQP